MTPARVVDIRPYQRRPVPDWPQEDWDRIWAVSDTILGRREARIRSTERPRLRPVSS